jgi:hypothetical protein
MLTHVTTPKGQAPIALRSLKWTHLEDTARAELPAGIFRWVEFGRQPPKEPRIELGLHPCIDDPPRRHLEQEGKYTFYLALVAANATARNYSFVVTLGEGGEVEFGEIAAEPLRRRIRRVVATGIGMSRGLSGSRG